jgi:pheromone shutdown protein TraB
VGLVLLVFAAIAWAFHRNAELGTQALRDWILFTGGFAALGALVAGAHPASIVAAFIAAPIKPFRPGIPAGGISAMAEAWVRRPRVADFETLRDDIGHWQGWWKNRVARTLLNFFMVSLGTIVGEYSAGIHIFRSLF